MGGRRKAQKERGGVTGRQAAAAGGTLVGRVALPQFWEEPSGTDASIPAPGSQLAPPKWQEDGGSTGPGWGGPRPLLHGHLWFLLCIQDSSRKDGRQRPRCHLGEFLAGEENSGFSPVPCKVQGRV